VEVRIDDIQVTKEMIEAGMEFYPASLAANEYDERLLCRIFKAMLAASTRNILLENFLLCALLETTVNRQQSLERNDSVRH